MEIVLILDNLRSMYNVGSLFRTADAFGVKEIICTGYTPTPDHPELAKTSLGAEKTVAWRKEEIEASVKRLKEQGFEIAALETGGKELNQFHPGKNKLALILGNETEGIAQSTQSLADVKLEIPMQGKKESLNVSVTGAIAIYHFSRV